MYRLIPFGSFLLNFSFFFMFIQTISNFFNREHLPMTDLTRAGVAYIIVLFLLYTRNGQRLVAYFAKGRNMIGREEKKLQPILNRIMNTKSVNGYSTPVLFQYRFFKFINYLTLTLIVPLNKTVKRMEQEYQFGTAKIFTFDSLDLESNSFGNTIYISKGAIDTLSEIELTAVIFNEFSQIRTNISNKRLWHQSGVLIARISAILIVLLAPMAIMMQLLYDMNESSTMEVIQERLEVLEASEDINTSEATENTENEDMSALLQIGYACVALARLLLIYFIMIKHKKNFTNLFYSLYERRIFHAADRETHLVGLSAPMLSYLEKLYHFKLKPKDYGQLFSELRPLVAYRINYYDNALGKNKDLDRENVKWSSNYIEKVQLLMNKKY